MRSHRARGRVSLRSVCVGRHEDAMVETLGILMVALVFLAFLVLIGRSF
jgi:hypothetical protein